MKYPHKVLAGTWAVLIGVAIVYCTPAGEILRATPGQHSFGVIDEGEPVVTAVKVENVGSAPVEITVVKTN